MYRRHIMPLALGGLLVLCGTAQARDPLDVPNDIQGADFGSADRHFQLRAERGTADRVYKVTYRVMDLAGNSTLATATVTVKKPK